MDMCRITIVTIIGMLLLFPGCTGGGTTPSLPPSTQDLSGIQGLWDFRIIIRYETGDVSPLMDTTIITGDLTIKPYEVTSGGDEMWEWSYDGVALTLRHEIPTYLSDPDCGGVYGVGVMTLIIPIDSTSEIATFSGYVTSNAYTDWCGPVRLNGVVEGYIQKN